MEGEARPPSSIQGGGKGCLFMMGKEIIILPHFSFSSPNTSKETNCLALLAKAVKNKTRATFKWVTVLQSKINLQWITPFCF